MSGSLFLSYFLVQPMPDLPDDYPFNPGSSRYPVVDLGELAARLGSPVVYDRRGEVIWAETFEFGITKWQGVIGGAGSSVAASTTTPFFSDQSLKLTAGGVAGGLAAAYRNFFALEDVKWGGYAAFAFLTTFDRATVELYKRLPATNYIAALQINNTEKKLQYRDENGDYQDFASIPAVVFSNGLYHQVKIVADFGLNEYVRAFFDDIEYDLSGLSIFQQTVASIQRNMLLATIYSDGATAAEAQIGAAVVTGNEP